MCQITSILPIIAILAYNFIKSELQVANLPSLSYLLVSYFNLS